MRKTYIIMNFDEIKGIDDFCVLNIKISLEKIVCFYCAMHKPREK